MSSNYKVNCRLVFVGNLPDDIRSKDLEDLFSKYGKINFIDLKNHRPSGTPFAFIQFEDERDANDAISERDGYYFKGMKVKVEFSNSTNRKTESGRKISKRSNYRCIISGLPPSGSWQDLKDHMREAGNVCYADVFKDGTGVVEYVRYDDMKYAARKLDDTKFRSHEGETSYIKVRIDPKYRRSRSRSDSRSSSNSRSSRSKSRSRGERATPTYSPVRSSRSRSRSSSRSKSPKYYRSRSRSRSRSRRSRSKS